MPSSGEKPGPGKYFCTKCGEKINIDNADQPLPVCPRCGHHEYLILVRPATE